MIGKSPLYYFKISRMRSVPRFDHFVRNDQEQGSVNDTDPKKGGGQDARRNPGPPVI